MAETSKNDDDDEWVSEWDELEWDMLFKCNHQYDQTRNEAQNKTERWINKIFSFVSATAVDVIALNG